MLLASGFWSEIILVSTFHFKKPLSNSSYLRFSLAGHKYGYLSRMSPSNFHSETEDSGFESLVTVTSDSSSSSSRMVSPHPPAPAPALANPPPPPMFNVRNGPPPERPHHYQFYNYNNRK